MTIVASLDPESGLYVPFRETIIASATPHLWRAGSAYGPLFTAVASPAIPTEHHITMAVWPLLTGEPTDPAPHLELLHRLSMAIAACPSNT
jgi:hypothetical protein